LSSELVPKTEVLEQPQVKYANLGRKKGAVEHFAKLR
jgi:hypothetical protein